MEQAACRRGNRDVAKCVFCFIFLIDSAVAVDVCIDLFNSLYCKLELIAIYYNHIRKSRMKNQNGKQMSGVKEIARRANVSIATVDRVIHNRSGVSESTKKRINEIIQEINFQPNILASRLASKKVNNFAILIPKSVETDFWEAPLSGIVRAIDEIKQYGISLSSHFFDLNDKMSFKREAENIFDGKVDGVLLAPSFIDESISFIQACQTRGIPYIFINSDIPGQDNLGYIGPHLFRSGYQAGQLISFGLPEGKILIVNISREMDSYHHLLRKEEGFKAYFNDNNKPHVLVKTDIRQTDEQAVESHLERIFRENPDIKAVFVTNSRVSAVAHYFKEKGIQDILLIGYDFLRENIEYLRQGILHFLICQKPEEQGYKGVMALFQHLVLSVPIQKEYYMPIDIITKENYEFYRN